MVYTDALMVASWEFFPLCCPAELADYLYVYKYLHF